MESMDNNINDNIEKSDFDAREYRRRETKLDLTDWLADLPEAQQESDLVEVRFKNTRKGYYRNPTHLKLQVGGLHSLCSDVMELHRPCHI